MWSFLYYVNYLRELPAAERNWNEYYLYDKLVAYSDTTPFTLKRSLRLHHHNSQAAKEHEEVLDQLKSIHERLARMERVVYER